MSAVEVSLLPDIPDRPLGDITAATIGHAIPIAPIPDDRGEWLGIRRAGIGGSDAAAICGQDPYRSPLEVWLDKTGQLPDDDRDNEAMAWGRILEPVVADEVAARTGLTLTAVRAVLAHPTREWQLANVDRAAHDGTTTGVYEGKTGSIYTADGWADDQVPDRYLLQGMHYLAVTGAPWLIFGVLIGGQRLEVRRVARDDELIDHLVSIEAEFWALVEARTPPAPDGSKACTELLAHLWDVTPGAVATLDRCDVDGLIDARRNLDAAIKTAETEKAAVENQLKTLIGAAEIAVDPDGQQLFTWKEQSRARFDSAAALAAHGDLLDPYRTTTTFRVLRIPKARRA